ncbi:cation:proton antiporter domain-containing protein [Croceicoccus naphthovorans]|uniref:Sodium:proton exchanger n=1 Tax=Croceicoccus naphthovorans TaxID=1348774 RepID=A0A0G3XEN3_9SPHN|nr:cation:proton antiporter [Croceicoccus naphthovorans]AKM09652.1 sodium:proton exchanger [Croceicoccus naphthovorans]MBB3990772.1 CPA2 family monovalent cation:H+ antiporter-2 [Croceicoccus naphthovorans]
MASELHFSPVLSDALVILGAAGIVIPVFARFRITPIIGFILVGMLVGPFGLGRLVFDYPWLQYVTITDPQGLDPFAEFGIILLLFTIGLELSFNRLWQLRRMVFGLGALELTISAALIAFALMTMGQYWTGALGLGLALALSSTALVLPISGTKSPVGKAALSMLLFEDIAIVPIIFLLGAMAPYASSDGMEGLWYTIWTGGLTVIVLMIGGRLLLPRLFAQAARTKSPELFLAASLLVVIIASLATAAVGLSPIVGALLAGLLIAETEYHTEVEGITAPFKGLALGIFLITVGMGVDLGVIIDNAWPIFLAVSAVLLVKALVTGGLLRMMGARRGTAVETGITMSSPSETTLIVLSAAATAQLIQPQTAQFWQIVTAIGLTITPILALLGRKVARHVDTAPATDEASQETDPSEGRAIILGYGRVGQLIADMMTRHDQRFLAIDSDPELVTLARRRKHPLMFADARGPALDRIDLSKASAIILTMDEPVLAGRLLRKLRERYPDIPIIARARDTAHAAELYRAGATEAVPETLESSLQLSEAVLVNVGVAMGPVIASIHEKRDEYREQIMREGELTKKPKLKTSLASRNSEASGEPV